MKETPSPSHPYTLPSRSRSPSHEPKLVKEYGCTNADEKKAQAYNKGSYVMRGLVVKLKT